MRLATLGVGRLRLEAVAAGGSVRHLLIVFAVGIEQSESGADDCSRQVN